jgi:hypothetical protein
MLCTGLFVIIGGCSFLTHKVTRDLQWQPVPVNSQYYGESLATHPVEDEIARDMVIPCTAGLGREDFTKVVSLSPFNKRHYLVNYPLEHIPPFVHPSGSVAKGIYMYLVPVTAVSQRANFD